MSTKQRSRASIATKFFIEGNSYYLDDFPYSTSIPKRFFIKATDIDDLMEWLKENTEEVFCVCFHDHTVRFKNKSDAMHMKLMLG